MDIWTEIMEAMKPIIETGKFIFALTFLMGVVRFGNWLDDKAEEKERRRKSSVYHDNDWL